MWTKIKAPSLSPPVTSFLTLRFRTLQQNEDDCAKILVNPSLPKCPHEYTLTLRTFMVGALSNVELPYSPSLASNFIR